MKITDTMTPKERAAALKAGKPIDRMPISLFHSTVGARIVNMTFPESISTPEKLAEKEIGTYRRFGCDGVSVEYGLNTLGSDLGSQLKEAKDASASIVSYACQTLDAIDELSWAKAEFNQSRYCQLLFEAAEIIHHEIGQEVGCSIEITGPMTAAASIISPDKILRATRKEPEKLHHLLQRVTHHLKALIDEFSKLNFLSFDFADPVSSGTLLHPKQYREFCLPYMREIVDYLHAKGKTATLHICGDTTKLLEIILETGIDTFSLDNVVDLSYAKEVMGQDVCLVGNVDPVKYFLFGSPETVKEAVRTCYAAGYDSPKGYFIAPGCGIPYHVTDENLDAYMDAARYYGQWPIDPERFIKNKYNL